MKKILLSMLLSLSCSVYASVAQVAPEASSITSVSPDTFIKEIVDKTVSQVIENKKDPEKINEIIEKNIMPVVDFKKMTISAMGLKYRQATPEQRKEITQEFQKLLQRTYSGAFLEINEKTTVQYLPVRGSGNTADVKTKVSTQNDKIDIFYKLEKQSDNSWKVIDLTIMDVSLVQSYKTQFAQVITEKGIDGLISDLKEKNNKK